ncbi:MAG: LamG-like jellyroll fold domain-containing protein, partial [Nanoarchaeota archaeon]
MKSRVIEEKNARIVNQAIDNHINGIISENQLFRKLGERVNGKTREEWLQLYLSKQKQQSRPIADRNNLAENAKIVNEAIDLHLNGVISEQDVFSRLNESVNGKTREEWAEIYLKNKSKQKSSEIRTNICMGSATEVNRIMDLYAQGRANEDQVYHTLNEKVGGRTKEDWARIYLRREKQRQVLEKTKKVVPMVIPLLLFLSLLFFIVNPSFTAYNTYDKNVIYGDNVQLTADSDTDYLWYIGNPGNITSLKLNGLINSSGVVKVYLLAADNQLLLFDSNNLKQDLGIYQGKKENIVENSSLDINLEYASDSAYDTDDNGVENVGGIIDLTVENSLIGLSSDKLCTKWILEDNQITTLCYGSTECCNIFGLYPMRNSWNEPFFLNYGLYNISYSSNVSAQIIYANYSLDKDNLYSDIRYSNIKAISASFYPEVFRFEDTCIETCNTYLDKGQYRLLIEVDDSFLKIDSLIYSRIERQPNKLPVFEEIPDQLVDDEVIINLSLYAYDMDNDTLTFTSSEPDDFDVIIAKDIATIIPKKGFVGSEYMFFIANDSAEIKVSNAFKVSVRREIYINKTESLEQGVVVIGKPVRWIKNVKMNDTVNNISINISNDALNLTVRKIDLGLEKEINEDNIKVIDKGVEKTVNEFIVDKKVIKIDRDIDKLESQKREYALNNRQLKEINTQLIEKTNERNQITGYSVIDGENGLFTKFIDWLSRLKVTSYAVLDVGESNVTQVIIDEKVSEVEVEYYTEGPTAEEFNVSDNVKRVVVSSDVHYENILTYSYLDVQQLESAIKLYWLVNGTRREFEFESFDTDSNGLVDYIQWITPSLSNQTFEIEINVLNVYSHPSLYGNWTVEFVTNGAANLTITTTKEDNYTTEYTRWTDYSDDNAIYDLKFIELRCGNNTLEYEWIGLDCGLNECSVFVENYSCNMTSYEISKVLTAEKHVLKFEFGDQTAYAYNDVTYPKVEFTALTLGNNSYSSDVYLRINVSIEEDNLSEVVYNWDGYNNTLHNGSLALMFNFDNISDMGENGTYFVDMSGNSHNGTGINFDNDEAISNGTHGGAIDFITNDYIDASYTDTFSEYTVSFWRKSEGSGVSSWPRMLYIRDSGSADAILIEHTDSTQNTLSIYSGTSGGLNNIGSLTLSQNEWHHFAMTYNGTDIIVYADTVVSLTDTDSGDLTFNVINIGGDPTSGRYFNGVIDEFKFWNRSLNSSEIYQEYISYLHKVNSTQWYLEVNQSENRTDGIANGTYTPFTCVADLSGNNNCTEVRYLNVGSEMITPSHIYFVDPTRNNASSTEDMFFKVNLTINESYLNEVTYNFNGTNYTLYNDSLVLMMNFDNVSALGENNTHVVDMSLYGNNGTIVGGNYTTPYGKYGGAIQFDGINDYVDVGSDGSLDLTGDFAMCFWFYSKSWSAANPSFMSKRDTWEGMDWEFWYDKLGSELEFWFGNSGAQILFNGKGINPSLNVWHHLVLTRKGNAFTFYLDGINQTTEINAVAFPIGDKIRIGVLGADVPTECFHGNIDEVRIWNRSLTTAEVYQEYVSNLNKYDTDKWNLFVNQSRNATHNLSHGTYTYQAFSQEINGIYNSTEVRSINVIPPIIRTQIDNCTNITSAGSYILNRSISDATTTCIKINVSHVDLDCARYTLDGQNSGVGIYVVGLAANYLTNITVSNCTITQFSSGFESDYTNHSSFTNIETYYNNAQGFNIYISNHINSTNISSYDNSQWGLLTDMSTHNATFTNILSYNNSLGGSQYGGFSFYGKNNKIRNANISWNSPGYGIYMRYLYNSIVDNATLYVNDEGMMMRDLSYNNFTNLRIYQNEEGLALNYDSDYNLFYGCNITNNSKIGLEFGWGNENGNYFYNNYFMNSKNIQPTFISNNWNTSNQSGPNIYGGPFIGGNYWGVIGGFGYSEICTDSNGDGYCDTPLVFPGATGIDYLPLYGNGTDGDNNLTNCSILEAPGSYYLSQSISNSASTCFTLRANDIIFDCNGHTIDGIDTSGIYGIFMDGGFLGNGIHLKNITIQNCNINDFAYGIYLDYVDNSTIFNTTVASAQNYGVTFSYSHYNFIINSTIDSNSQGIFLSGSNYNNITNNLVDRNYDGMYIQYSSTYNNIWHNNITNSTRAGIYFNDADPDNNHFFDNLFNNTQNIRNYPGANNYWNTTNQSGINILGGNAIGGNVWAVPNGWGKSYVCNDSNGDEYCDDEYRLLAGAVDYLPLYTPGTDGNNNITECIQIDADGYYYLGQNITGISQTCLTITGLDAHLDCRGSYLEGTLIGSTKGIYAYGLSLTSSSLTNLTIDNCNIGRYYTNLMLDYVNESIINNSYIYSSVSDNIYMSNSKNDKISNFKEYNNSGGWGIRLSASLYNILTNVSAHNGSNSGIYLSTGSNYNQFNDITISRFASAGVSFETSISNTVYNISLSFTYYGFSIYESTGTVVNDGRIFNNTHGIFLDRSSGTISNNQFTNLRVTNNTYGASMNKASISNNYFYDNFFSNYNNTRYYSGSLNLWNISNRTDINIMGGSITGGNFWHSLNESETGYSENCTDEDKDGICDISYNMTSTEIDYHPLAKRPINMTLVSPTNANNTIDLQGNISFNCSAQDMDELNQLVNITLYTNLNQTAGWSAIETRNLTWFYDSANFTVDARALIGNNTLRDSLYIWNCIAYDEKGLSNWADSNYSLSGWDNGNYSNITINLSSNSIGLTPNSTGHYPNMSGTYLSKVFDAGYFASWVNLSWDETRPINTSINISCRSCDDPNCDTETFIELGDNASFTNLSSIADSRYLQYKMVLWTTNVTNTPELLLTSVTIKYGLPNAPNITTVYPNSTGGESYEEREIINVSVTEPNSLTFNITYTNESPVVLNWYVAGVENVTFQNKTHFNWTGNYTQEGNYTILVNVSNDAGFSYQYWNLSVNDSLDTVYPLVNFTYPTPDNASTVTDSYFEVNVSIEESDLKEVVYTFDGTNHTIYNDSLVFMVNLDNVSALGEKDYGTDNQTTDVSKYGNNGTIYGARWNLTGKYAGAFAFDGVDDYITFPDRDYYTFGDGTNDYPFSVSCWVYVTNNIENNFVAKYDATPSHYEWTFGTKSDGVLYFQLADDSEVGYRQRDYDTPFPTNDWHYVVGTYNGLGGTNAADGINIYMDGVLVDDHTSSGGSYTAMENTPSELRVGYHNAAGYAMSGMIDEVRIWNRTLNSSEIYQQYASNLNKFNTTQWYLYINQSKNATTVLDEGTYTIQSFATDSDNNHNLTEIRYVNISIFPLINFTYPTPDNDSTVTDSYFKVNVSIEESNLKEVVYNFNGTNYTMYNDSLVFMMNLDNVSALGEKDYGMDNQTTDVSRFGNNGTIYGVRWNATGKYGGAFVFDGIDDYIVTGKTFPLNASLARTISLWSRLTSLPSADKLTPLVSWGWDGAGAQPENGLFAIVVQSYWGYTKFGVWGILNDHWTTQSLEINKWYNLIAVYDGNNDLKIYIDGNLNYSNSTVVPFDTLDSELSMGKCMGCGTYGDRIYFSGSLDEVRIWNRSLTADEVYQQYVSNLNKYDVDKWLLDVNESSLSDGTYIYQACASDVLDQENCTEVRTLEVDFSAPLINFTYPTPDNGTIQAETWVDVNVTIEESNLG